MTMITESAGARPTKQTHSSSSSADGARDMSHGAITVLMNTQSGQKDKSPARDAIHEILLASGRDVKIIQEKNPRRLGELARAAATERPGILVAAGGDGTLNTVATAAFEAKLPFGVLPMGTFNYFARDLGISLEPAEAAQVLLDGVSKRVPLGRVNGHLFLNNASIGLYRRLIEDRERHKQRFGRNQLVALLSAVVTLFRPHRSYRLRMEIDGKSELLVTPSVFFGRNALQMEQLGLDEAECVNRGEIAVLAPREVSRTEMVGLALRGALAQLETATNLHQHCAMHIRADWIGSTRRHISVAVDGEVRECTLPLIVESIPSALEVIVPAPPAALEHRQ